MAALVFQGQGPLGHETVKQGRLVGIVNVRAIIPRKNAWNAVPKPVQLRLPLWIPADYFGSNTVALFKLLQLKSWHPSIQAKGRGFLLEHGATQGHIFLPQFPLTM